MKWYMTVGVPGGDFAIRTDADSADASLFPHVAGIFGDSTDFACIRPCPPELVEWIEARDEAVQIVPYRTRCYRNRVEGGWVYNSFTLHTETFVPVAGAAGLTVLGG